MREAKQLLLASKQFASEHRWLSWWHLWSTLLALGGLLTVASLDLPWVVRGVASLFAGLVLVRLFVIYHDYQHGAILAHSRIASFIMLMYGIFALNPPSIWNRSHNHHHKNNAKIFGASIGSYPVMTVEAYAEATRWERFVYGASRHWITISLGYVTVFLIGMCLRPFILSPKKHFDAGVSVVVHLSLAAWLAWQAPDILFLGLIGPAVLASALGAYLFYAQHNFPDVKLRDRKDWTYVDAALHSSSYIKMSPIMHWFTGNIGYHHVHHLNSRIPFYRLPEAMAALEELQSPGTTSLSPRDVARCLSLKLWDFQADRLTTFDGRPIQVKETKMAA